MGIDSDISIEGYDLLGEVGRGGFGIVHRARQAGLDRDVAIKVLAAGRLNEDASRRFERECRVLGRLSDHPNIVTVHGSGFTQAGQPFIAMEYLARGSLSDRIAHQGPMPWQEAVDHIVKVAGALETAHRGGILHRDVKPENILLSSYGEPMLADFGIARVDDGTRTQAGAIATSLAHAAPEILDGREPSAASDVYALASTLFQLIAGSLAFESGDGGVVSMIGKVLHRPVPDLRPQGVPDPICSAIEAGMSKTLEGRPATAEGFGAMIAEAARQAGHEVAPARVGAVEPEVAPISGAPVTKAPADPTRIHARPAPAVVPPGGEPPVPSPAPSREPAAAPGTLPARARPGWLVPAAAALAVVLGAAAWIVSNRPNPAGVPIAVSTSDGIDAGTPAATADPVDPSANTGEARVDWQQELVGGNSPVLFVQAVGGAVAVRRADRLDLHDFADGGLRWSAQFVGEDPAPAQALLLPDLESMLVRQSGIAVAFDLGTAVQRYRVVMDAFAVLQGLILELLPPVVTARDPATALVRWVAELPEEGPVQLAWTPDSTSLAIWTEHHLVVLDPETGEVRSSHEGSAPIRAVVAAGEVAFVARNGDEGLLLESVDMTSGELRPLLQRGRDFDAPRMVATEDTVALYDGSALTAMSTADGTVQWQVPLEIEDPLLELTSRGIVVVDGPAAAATLLRIDLYEDGAPACQQQLPAFDVVPVVTDNHVHVSTRDGRQLAYDVGTCELSWSYTLPEGRVAVQSLQIDVDLGQGVLLDDGGWLTAFRLWDR